MSKENRQFGPNCQTTVGDDISALEGWLDDGGSLRPAAILPARRTAKVKQPTDTAQGCRDRAAADLLASASMTTNNARLKMETSASCWTARADLLQRLDDSFEARIAAQRLMR